MTLYLKQATARNIGVGQLLSSTDGLTAFTTAVATTDVHLWKGTETTLAHSEAATVNISNGVHYLALGTTDTDTVGSMIIFIQPTGCLPLRIECCVLPANVYDSLIGGGAVDLLDVSTVQWTGTAVHTPVTNGVPVVDVHDTSATAVAINKILGLSQENYSISSPGFTSGRLTSFTLKTFLTKAHHDAGTPVLATYTVTAAYDGNGLLTTYDCVIV